MIVSEVLGVLAEVANQGADDSTLPIRAWLRRPLSRLRTHDETHQRCLSPVVRRIVEDGAERPVGADDLAGETGLAPKGKLVRNQNLHRRTHCEALRDLVSPNRQRRLVLDAPSERGGTATTAYRPATVP